MNEFNSNKKKSLVTAHLCNRMSNFFFVVVVVAVKAMVFFHMKQTKKQKKIRPKLINQSVLNFQQ